MSFNDIELQRIKSTLRPLIDKKRPPAHLRSQVDIAFRVEDQSVYIYEIRPHWKNPEKIQKIDVAKATFVRTKNHWKIFWMRADLKWHGYEPDMFVDSVEEFFRIVDEDKGACFWG